MGEYLDKVETAVAVPANQAVAVGLSVLLTPMVDSLVEVARALKAAGLREKVKTAIGGAGTALEIDDAIGVDTIGRDAVEAVDILDGLVGGWSGIRVRYGR